jgi:hypothetical protein
VQLQFGHYLTILESEVAGNPRAFFWRRVVLRNSREREEPKDRQTNNGTANHVSDYHGTLPDFETMQERGRVASRHED